ncbi:MAG: ribosome maturation factor RimM [Gammaproteobacteria bacterium]
MAGPDVAAQVPHPGPAGRMVVLGRLLGVFGVRGELRLQSFTSPPEAVLGYPALHAATASGGWQPFRFAGGRRQGEFWLVRIEGVTDRDAAAAWALREVAVPRATLPPPGPGEYYLDDLPGMEVVTSMGKVLGRVSHLVDTPAHPVMLVVGSNDQSDKPRETWVPVVRQHVRGVDLDAGRVMVDWEEE